MLKAAISGQQELDKRYPLRHVTIHKHPCKHCPSMRGSDPEADEIKTYPKEIIVNEFLFVCAWRQSKLCKGNCDAMGITQEDINRLKIERK